MRTLSEMTTNELVQLNTCVCNAMERAAHIDKVEAMKSLLRIRRTIRTEIDRRKAQQS
ncbi:MAG: hypothetical protein KGL39_49445 [Patescibacteria group bacterium]|nr:hypothetical protein [Patescibacteria group bacterium]